MKTKNRKKNRIINKKRLKIFEEFEINITEEDLKYMPHHKFKIIVQQKAENAWVTI